MTSDDLSLHEVLDRIHVISMMLDKLLLEHPTVHEHKCVEFELEAAMTHLHTANRQVSCLHFKTFSDIEDGT